MSFNRDWSTWRSRSRYQPSEGRVSTHPRPVPRIIRPVAKHVDVPQTDFVPLFVFDKAARQCFYRIHMVYSNITSVEFSTRYGAIVVTYRQDMGGRIRGAADVLEKYTSMRLVADSMELYQDVRSREGRCVDGKRFWELLRKAPRVHTSPEYYDSRDVNAAIESCTLPRKYCWTCRRYFNIDRRLGKTIDGRYYCTSNCIRMKEENDVRIEQSLIDFAREQQANYALQQRKQQAKEEWQWLQKGKRLLTQVRRHLQSEARAALQSPPRASEPDTTSPIS